MTLQKLSDKELGEKTASSDPDERRIARLIVSDRKTAEKADHEAIVRRNKLEQVKFEIANRLDEKGLQKIIDSPNATPEEKALAKQGLKDYPKIRLERVKGALEGLSGDKLNEVANKVLASDKASSEEKKLARDALAKAAAARGEAAPSATAEQQAGERKSKPLPTITEEMKAKRDSARQAEVEAKNAATVKAQEESNAKARAKAATDEAKTRAKSLELQAEHERKSNTTSAKNEGIGDVKTAKAAEKEAQKKLQSAKNKFAKGKIVAETVHEANANLRDAKSTLQKAKAKQSAIKAEAVAEREVGRQERNVAKQRARLDRLTKLQDAAVKVLGTENRPTKLGSVTASKVVAPDAAHKITRVNLAKKVDNMIEARREKIETQKQTAKEKRVKAQTNLTAKSQARKAATSTIKH